MSIGWPIFAANGQLLFAQNGQLAMSTDCCCPFVPIPCCSPNASIRSVVTANIGNITNGDATWRAWWAQHGEWALQRVGNALNWTLCVLNGAYEANPTRWPHPEDDQVYNRICVSFWISCTPPVGIYPGIVTVHISCNAMTGAKTGVGYYEEFARNSVSFPLESEGMACGDGPYGPYQWGEFGGFNADATWNIT